MKIKICGVTNLPDAISAVLLGADYAGFIVEVKTSKDRIKRQEAKEIISKLPDTIRPVYVTLEKKSKKIIEIAKEIHPAIIQLHGDITVAEIKKLRKSLKSIELMKAIIVKDLKSIDEAKKFESLVDYILLDSPKDKTGKGKKHNWEISKKIVELVHKPVFLAGGLTPENVREAVQKVQPYAADVNSGVETVKRKKDHHKMLLFIKRAKK